MKKVNNFNFLSILFLSIILLFIYPNNKAFSFDWLSYGPYEEYPSCLEEGPNWSKPLEGIYCYDDPSNDCYGCCFKVIFSYRWTGTNNRNFEVLIRDVFLKSGNNCVSANCNKYNVVWGYVFHSLLPGYANDAYSGAAFYEKIRNGKSLGESLPVTIYGKAECFSGPPNSLSTCAPVINRCCKKTFTFQYYIEPMAGYKTRNDILENLETIPVPCVTPPCTVYCDFSPIQNDPDLCYDCEIGTWIAMEPQTFPLDDNYPVCPGCSLKITYDYRKNETCYPAWKEYRIHSVEKINCESCTLDEGDIYTYATYAVLQNGPYPFPKCPPATEHATNFRVVKAKCWEVIPPANGHGEILQECQNNFGCCKWVFETWIDGNWEKHIQPIAGGDQRGPLTPCQQPCFAFCEDFGYNKNSIKEKVGNTVLNDLSYVRPNPTNNTFEILLVSNQMGTIKFNLFDVLGNILFEKSIKKENSELVVPINSLNYAKGVYKYIFELDGKIISNGSVIIK